jgi:hypothetical protein
MWPYGRPEPTPICRCVRTRPPQLCLSPPAPCANQLPIVLVAGRSRHRAAGGQGRTAVDRPGTGLRAWVPGDRTGESLMSPLMKTLAPSTCQENLCRKSPSPEWASALGRGPGALRLSPSPWVSRHAFLACSVFVRLASARALWRCATLRYGGGDQLAFRAEIAACPAWYAAFITLLMSSSSWFRRSIARWSASMSSSESSCSTAAR